MASVSTMVAVSDDVGKLSRHSVELSDSIRQMYEELWQNQEAIQRLKPVGTSTPAINGNGQSRALLAKVAPAKVTPPNAKGSKTDFVVACFRQNPATNPKAIDRYWVEGGGAGHISPSTVYKTKHALRVPAKRKVAAERKAPSGRRAATDSEVREVIWGLLTKQPMNVNELTTAIREGLLDPLPRKLYDVIKEALSILRAEGKVYRGDQQRYSVVEGVSLV